MPENLNHSDDQAGKELGEKRNTLGDIRLVGSEKPLGYLPFSYIAKFGETPEHLIAESSTRGLEHRIVQLDTNTGSESYLYVYDRNTLQQLLDQSRQVLEKANWPADASAFVDYVARHKAPTETDLFDVVANAFADYTNPCRKTFPQPLSIKQRLNIALIKFIGGPQFARNRREFNKSLKGKQQR